VLQLLIITLSAVALLLFYLTRHIFRRSARLYDKYYYRFFWNDTLRVILETYQPIVLLSME
jgi:hypothetical protein